MANFNIQITNRGRALQAKAQAGTPLVFTRMRIGSGSLSGQQIADMTALIDPKMWLPINKSVASSAGKYTVGAYLSSDNVTTGFYFREWGVFAQDPDLGEILYCYGNVGAGAEYIAAGGGSDAVEKQLDAITIIGNAANVSAVLDESLVFPSRREFEEHKEAEVLDHPDGSVTTAKLANGAATDDKIGNRTISDATAPTSNTGKLTGLLSGLANMIKSITGGATWRTAPGMTIAAIKTILDAATNAATANTLIKRDANGRAKVAAPSATDDIARKAEVDAAISTAAADATSKANAAQSAAISAAASDATSKANAAQAAAISAAASDATSKVDAHASDTVKHITASERTNWNAKETTTGAQSKANAARDAAISAAATDATTKANAVQSNLNSHVNNSILHPAKDGTLQEDLNAEMVGGWRIYTHSASLGLNDSSTMQQVFDAMPDKSKFYLNVYSANMGALELPSSGSLEIVKTSSSRAYAKYSSVNKIYMDGSFDGNGIWRGWIDSQHIGTTATPTFNGVISNAGTATGGASHFVTQSGGKRRFNHALYGVESTGNGGANYGFYAYDDNGDYLGSVYTVNRSSQVLNFIKSPTVPTLNINTSDNQAANTAFVNAYAVNSVASGSSSDPNTTQESYILTNHGNGPGGGLYWHIYTMFYSNKTANRAQIAVSYNNPTSALLRIRQCFSGSWTDWKDMAPSDSPNFTGNVRVPTAATGSNDTTAANTSFVQKTVDNANSIKAIDNRAVRPNNLKDDSLAHYFSSLGGMTGSANTSYVDILALNGYHDTSGQKVNALVFAKGNQAIYHYQGTYGATTWGSPKTLAYTDAIPEIATEAEAEAGADNAAMMTPWRVKQAIDNRTRYGTTTGTSTAYVLTLSPAPSKLYSGMDVKIKLHTAPGTNPTLNVNGLGAKALYAANGTDRFQGVAGRIYTFIYDGTAFILASGGGWHSGDVIETIDTVKLKDDQQYSGPSNGISYHGIFVDSSDHVWVPLVSSIRKYNSQGQLLATYTKTESAGSTSEVGVGAAEDFQGNFFLAFYPVLRKMNPAGSTLWYKVANTISNLVDITQIAVDSTGAVYVAHKGSSSPGLTRFTTIGGQSWVKVDVGAVTGVVVSKSDYVYELSSNQIRRMNSNGVISWTKTATGAITIATDDDDNVYWATTNNLVVSWDKDGNERWRYQLNHTSGTPSKLNWDNNSSTMWLSTGGTQPSGATNLLSIGLNKLGEVVYGSTVDYPAGAAWDSQGSRYVATNSSSRPLLRIYRKNTSGSYVL